MQVSFCYFRVVAEVEAVDSVDDVTFPQADAVLGEHTTALDVYLSHLQSPQRHKRNRAEPDIRLRQRHFAGHELDPQYVVRSECVRHANERKAAHVAGLDLGYAEHVHLVRELGIDYTNECFRAKRLAETA